MTTVGAKGESQSAEITQTGTKSQESSGKITKVEWLISIENCKVDETAKKSQIERVPSLLRQSNSDENCYDPIVVSIGPYHHGKPGLEAFEQLKIPIAQKLCCDHSNQVSLESLYEEVAKVGKSARECYEKGSTEDYDDELFNRMMFLDACFVLYLMFILKEKNVSSGTDKEQRVDPRLYMGYYQGLMISDLFLLENQIPLLILKVLMDFMFNSEIQEELIQSLLKSPTISKSRHAFMKLDLDGSPHLLHLIWKQLSFRPITKVREEYWDIWESYRTVTELDLAGIHVKPSQTGNLTDVEFKSRLFFGTLTLPQIVIDDLTKPLLFNLVAYEMCPHGPSDLGITSYFCLMDYLIDRADDVKELRKRKILVNFLGSDQELAQFFNKIAKDLVPDATIYAEAKRKIEIHCQNKVQAWMAEWVHKYFSSPWTLLAFLGAILVLALTMAQTYFAAYTYYTSESKTS
ncbi:Hypothetical predicted protein [Olea europaea subsp. europaea]|uniref:Uncharacterized protein n=1 Tax=Olea europaea subsp. europaea TaxID=158383 RepID=A0A8S0TNW1_OLEEU|nr:Hypothetical predicted protein [Olea europaea subsp. europaea]